MNLIQELLAKVLAGHGGSAAGGALILDGIKANNPEQIAVGVGTLLATAGLSAFRKWKRRREAKKVVGSQE